MRGCWVGGDRAADRIEAAGCRAAAGEIHAERHQGSLFRAGARTTHARSDQSTFVAGL